MWWLVTLRRLWRTWIGNIDSIWWFKTHICRTSTYFSPPNEWHHSPFFQPQRTWFLPCYLYYSTAWQRQTNRTVCLWRWTQMLRSPFFGTQCYSTVQCTKKWIVTDSSTPKPQCEYPGYDWTYPFMQQNGAKWTSMVQNVNYILVMGYVQL